MKTVAIVVARQSSSRSRLERWSVVVLLIDFRSPWSLSGWREGGSSGERVVLDRVGLGCMIESVVILVD